jgi:hypothetical protein
MVIDHQIVEKKVKMSQFKEQNGDAKFCDQNICTMLMSMKCANEQMGR